MRAVDGSGSAGESERPIIASLKRKAAELLALLRSAEEKQLHAGCEEYIQTLEQLAADLDGRKLTGPSAKAWREFGQLVRDKRNAAGYSRSQLAHRSRLSDATIKFIETAKTVPSRTSLIRLIGVQELNLSWDMVPGRMPAPASVEAPVEPARFEELNCYLAEGEDPTSKVMTFGKFLQGSGGHVEQTNAYLDHQSAAAYMAMCQHSPVAATLRASLPLDVVAEEIVRKTPGGLNFLALGSGDGSLEVRLVQHLMSLAPAPFRVELYLLDVSQPLLSAAYKHAIDTLGGSKSAVQVTAMQCNFHHLPLYTQLHYAPTGRRPRLFCLLGGTLANLDNEPRFFQHSLVGSEPGDLLLVDFQLARAAPSDPEGIKRRDRSWERGVSAAHADWLSGPIWRHCKDVLAVEFHWNLETQCPMPGSYALEAIATVQQRGRPDRQFCMFQFRRYDPRCVEECLRRLGWELLRESPYGPVDGKATLMLYRKAGGGA